MMTISLYTPAEVALDIADRVRDRRLARGWTQAELARRSGVALSTLKLFEHKGHIALGRLLRIASALDDLQSFQRLFEPPKAQSLDELEARAARPTRKYGRTAKPKAHRVARKSSSKKAGRRAGSNKPPHGIIGPADETR